jgi:hypothetical protein
VSPPASFDADGAPLVIPAGARFVAAPPGATAVFDDAGRPTGFVAPAPECFDAGGAPIAIPPRVRLIAASGGDTIAIFDATGRLTGFIEPPPECFDDDGIPVESTSGARFIPAGSSELAEIGARMRLVFDRTGESVGFIRNDPECYDADGRPFSLAANMRFFPKGTIKLGGDTKPFAIRAVYAKEGSPCGFVQIFEDTAASESAQPTTLFDAMGAPAAVTGFVADGVAVRALNEDGSVVAEVFDAVGRLVEIARIVARTGETRITDAGGRRVDGDALFDADRRPIAALLTDFNREGHFTDAKGEPIAGVRDAAGMPIELAGAIENRTAFDAQKRRVSQPVFRDRAGRPIFIREFTPERVFDSSGKEVPQTLVADEHGHTYVYGSIAPPPSQSVFFDETGRNIVLTYDLRVPLFQLCDNDRRLVKRKVIFDGDGRAIGSVLSDFEGVSDHVPRAIFAAFPENEHSRNRSAKIAGQGSRRRLEGDPLASLSEDAKVSFMKFERIMPIVLPWEQTVMLANGIYDLIRMKKIAFATAKQQVRALAAKPLRDIGFAIKVFKLVISKRSV